MNKQLFGGALIAAGLSAPGAAQEFNITGTTGPQSDIIGVDFFVFQYVTIDADFYDESMLRVDSYARTMASPTTILAFADVNSGGFAAYVLHFDRIHFEVTEDALVRVSWNFLGDTDGLGGIWRDSRINVRGPDVFVLGDLRNPVGSEEVTLRAGEDYTYVGNALSLAGEPESFFRIEILSDCPADLDGDGDTDADDFFAYLDAFAAGVLDICDIDGDGDCDADDFFGYLDAFAIGC